MARSPQKTCPNLSRLLDDAEEPRLAAFLNTKPFERLDWLDEYRQEAATSGARDAVARMLAQEKKVRLSSLETEAARIITIAGDRGQFALDGLAREKLGSDRLHVLLGQRDELARSLWTFVEENALFEAAENSLHLRLYRRYDKHYQTFLAEPGQDGRCGEDDGSALDRLLQDLRDVLDRGEGYHVDRFDIPADDGEPAAEMYLLFHPNPPTSVREIDDAGNRYKIYFRPPGEAMIVYTPSTGRVHVRAGSRVLRHTIADRFARKVLDCPLSSQPVDFQAYDVTRFFSGFDLDLPDFHDVTVRRAQVIRIDVSIGNLANRLALSTTINQDLTAVIDAQPGLGRIFERAVAIRFVEIAVRYLRTGRDSEQTLEFTLTDRNTSSLLSLDDAFERVLGHRLLRHWGILREGRPPSEAESKTAIPALLELWDIGADKISGAWLAERNIDAGLLSELGFLVPTGWEGEELIDEGDGLGPVDAEVVPRPSGKIGGEDDPPLTRIGLRTTPGQETPGLSTERYRVYRVRDGWVAQHLREQVTGILDECAVEEVSAHLLALGTLQIDGRAVPVYLARSLGDERVRAAVDTQLRARHGMGIGLVLQAGDGFGTCLAANVLTKVTDHIDDDVREISLSVDSLKTVFRRNRGLARGGQTVDLTRTGDNAGTLFVPGKGTIDIAGENRLIVIDRLVNAHNNGPAPMATADLVKGIEGQSLANIFGRPLWDKLKDGFVRSPRQKLWEIAS